MRIKTGIYALFLVCSVSLRANTYKAGDVILASIPCYICSLIELEEDSSFSHIGVINQEKGELVVYEAWGKVKKTPLDIFLTRLKKNKMVRIIRHQDHRSLDKNEMHYYFSEYYQGLRYDGDFRWRNKDRSGNEKYYCSEFVYKFLSHFISFEMMPKKMHFNKHRKTWEKFFRNNVPDNLPGLSPEDFNKASEFKLVQEFIPHD